MEKNKRDIAILGAGIAGLTAALCLAHAGFHVQVFDRLKKLPPSGAGIQVSPNALKVLSYLGLSCEVRKFGFVPEAIEIGDGLSGKHLTKFNLGAEIQDRYGAGYITLHRADLARVLLDACNTSANVDVQFGHELFEIAVESESAILTVQTNDGQTQHRVAAIIGADGVHSKTRTFVPDSMAPRFAGHIAWRSAIPFEQVNDLISRNSTGLWLGPDAHIVHYPMQQGDMLNVVAIAPWQDKVNAPTGWISPSQEFGPQSAFRDWAEPLQSLLSKQNQWGGWPIYAHDKSSNSSAGPICLIGDAVHTLLPYAAQGGAMAIEDAAVLARCCAATPNDMSSAFQNFSDKRRGRLEKVRQLSENNRRIYHLRFPLSAFRNLAMRAAPQAAIQKRMSWLYGWTADGA